MTDHILVAVQDGVMTLTFNRPDKKNAITDAMYGVLADSLVAAEADPAVRVILFNSRGDSFTSGNDLSDFAAQNASQDTGARGERNVGRFLKALAHAKKPLVASVRGLAVGVGTTMLLHCDLVYIADKDSLDQRRLGVLIRVISLFGLGRKIRVLFFIITSDFRS